MFRHRVAHVVQREKSPNLRVVSLDMEEMESHVGQSAADDGLEDPTSGEYVPDQDATAPERPRARRQSAVQDTAGPPSKPDVENACSSVGHVPWFLREKTNHAQWVRSKIVEGFGR